MTPMRAQLKPGWPTCDKCGNRWDPLLVFVSNCPKCGAAIPDAPITRSNVVKATASPYDPNPNAPKEYPGE
jgi:predicted RNA-binding Zn-ribbon protein involved in translation (DUF1610 family)